MKNLIIVVCILTPIQTWGEEPWSQWRGPNRNGTVAGLAWPTKLGEKNLRLKWRKELGPSYSGAIITEKFVFVTETKDKKTEHVYAMDRKTGEKKWEASWVGSMRVPFFAARNGSWIRSTPAYDGKSLFVGGIRNVLVCLNASTGEERWRIDFAKKFDVKIEAFGHVCSPLVDADFVYTQTAAGIFKIKSKTGEIVWRALKEDGGMNAGAFSSPIIAKVAGKRILVAQTRTQIAGIRLEDGKVHWQQKIPAFRGMNILTPSVIGDQLFTSSYGGGSFLFKVSRKDSTFNVERVWKTPTQGYMSSPVIIDGHVYLHLRNRRFVCLDLKDGGVKWTTRPYGQYWSLVANGQRILALDQTGNLLLINANPKEFEVVDQRRVSKEETWAHIAVMKDTIAIRELKAIAVWEWKK